MIPLHQRRFVGSLLSARLAQSVEHETLNLRVVGSSPTLGEKFFLATNVAKGFMGSSGI